MADARDAAGAMDVEADVALGPDARLAGVHAHSDAYLGVVGPRLRGQRALRGDGGGERAGRGGKGDEEGIALGPDLDAAVRRECGPKKLLVACKDRRPSLAVRLEQPGRALDVGEQEGDRPGQ